MAASLQDVVAIGAGIVAAAWLARTLFRRLAAPSCGPPPGVPAGHDGFVPLDAIAPPSARGPRTTPPTRSGGGQD